MLPVKADRAGVHLASRVVTPHSSLSTFAISDMRLFELRPGLLSDVDTDSWRR
jgi:hypothetical protein